MTSSHVFLPFHPVDRSSCPVERRMFLGASISFIILYVPQNTDFSANLSSAFLTIVRAQVGSQALALCKLQLALNYPTLNGWDGSTYDCASSAAASWTDLDMQSFAWEGVSWTAAN